MVNKINTFSWKKYIVQSIIFFKKHPLRILGLILAFFFYGIAYAGKLDPKEYIGKEIFRVGDLKAFEKAGGEAGIARRDPRETILAWRRIIILGKKLIAACNNNSSDWVTTMRRWAQRLRSDNPADVEGLVNYVKKAPYAVNRHVNNHCPLTARPETAGGFPQDPSPEGWYTYDESGAMTGGPAEDPGRNPPESFENYPGSSTDVSETGEGVPQTVSSDSHNSQPAMEQGNSSFSSPEVSSSATERAPDVVQVAEGAQEAVENSVVMSNSPRTNTMWDFFSNTANYWIESAQTRPLQTLLVIVVIGGVCYVAGRCVQKLIEIPAGVSVSVQEATCTAEKSILTAVESGFSSSQLDSASTMVSSQTSSTDKLVGARDLTTGFLQGFSESPVFYFFRSLAIVGVFVGTFFISRSWVLAQRPPKTKG